MIEPGWSGPSLLLMRGAREDLIDLRTRSQQLSFWPEEEPELRLSAPGPEYPWLYYERAKYYEAKCIHPAIASAMAHEDVANHEKRLIQKEAKMEPPLFNVA